MRLLLDANIFLDLPQDRVGSPASRVLVSLLGHHHQGFAAWHTLSVVYYVARRVTGKRSSALELVRDILQCCEVAPVGHVDALRANSLNMADFEDALQVAAAQASLADCIVTRDSKDYAGSPIPALTPEQFLRMHHPHLKI